MSVKTHYDTLKVTQDAPDEVISAAYKALARIYHPDKAGDSLEAMAVMQEINISYKILSDPLKRKEHDRWISQQEEAEKKKTNMTGGLSARGPVTAKRSASMSAAAAGSDKSMAEAVKWKAWADKTAQEAKEAQERADKALADLAKAKTADRAKWETWVEKTGREAKEAQERAEKAAAQSARFVEAALKTRVQGDDA